MSIYEFNRWNLSFESHGIRADHRNSRVWKYPLNAENRTFQHGDITQVPQVISTIIDDDIQYQFPIGLLFGLSRPMGGLFCFQLSLWHPIFEGMYATPHLLSIR